MIAPEFCLRGLPRGRRGLAASIARRSSALRLRAAMLASIALSGALPFSRSLCPGFLRPLSDALIFARCSVDLGLPTHRSCNRCRASADGLCVFESPVCHAWMVFALAVHHSRFVATLLVLQPSLWLICGRLSGFGMNASATSRCTLRQYGLLFMCNITA